MDVGLNAGAPEGLSEAGAHPRRTGRVGFIGRFAVVTASMLPLACASSGEGSWGDGSGPGEPDAASVAQEALDATLPESPVQITFGFRLKEADLRFAGRGVGRVQPPYRVRVDLFSNQGDGLFLAALVGSDLRVPPGVPLDLAPPPALLWAALGVFRPDADLRLAGGRRAAGDRVELRYEGEVGKELRFSISEGGILTRAELREEGHLVEEVDLTWDERSENVVETVYRNRALFLELTFTLESVETVDSFPFDIWYPGG